MGLFLSSKLACVLAHPSWLRMQSAERVAQSLSGIVSMAEVPTATGGADVTVIAGTTFHVVKPGTHHVGLPSGISTLGPVSSAVQSLPAYDPRACPGK